MKSQRTRFRLKGLADGPFTAGTYAEATLMNLNTLNGCIIPRQIVRSGSPILDCGSGAAGSDFPQR
jgi:hypothetical protein